MTSEPVLSLYLYDDLLHCSTFSELYTTATILIICSSPIIFCCTAIVCQTLRDVSQFLRVPGCKHKQTCIHANRGRKSSILSPTFKGNSAVWDSALGLHCYSKVGKFISNYLCITSIVPSFGHLIPQPSHKLLCKTEKLLCDIAMWQTALSANIATHNINII